MIAVDALAAASPERLGTTVQMSDGGIAPGAGVGNRRAAPTDASGRTVLPLSNFPVYVRVPRAQADALAAAFEGAK